ncbi:MAG TPA: hypothetical protein VMF86_03625 [Stellaceae bacterium]|nr:hypothetical protein [Stellaceae bacterium]
MRRSSQSAASATRSTGREGGLRRARSRAFSSGKTIGTFQDTVPLVDIERLVPQAGEGFLGLAGIDEMPPVPAAPLDGHEVAQMIADVLLHGVVGAQMRGDLGIDLVPRPADLTLQIAPERRQVFVQLLGITGDEVPAAHAFPLRKILKRRGAAAMVDAAAARTFDDHARHVGTHGSAPAMSKGDRARHSVRLAQGRRRQNSPRMATGAIVLAALMWIGCCYLSTAS